MEPFFTERQDRQFTVVEFQTESLMNARDLEQIGGALYRLVDEEHRNRLLLDFSKVRYPSSQAIGIIVTLNKKLSQKPNGKLILCGVRPELLQVLKITRLDRILSMCPTQRDAIEAGSH